MTSIEKAYVQKMEFKKIPAGKKELDLLELRVAIDRSYRDGQDESGAPRYNHDKNYWITVQIWGNKANRLAEILEKGARILMTGKYEEESWTDKEGKKRKELHFRADQVAVDPTCIRDIIYRSNQ